MFLNAIVPMLCVTAAGIAAMANRRNSRLARRKPNGRSKYSAPNSMKIDVAASRGDTARIHHRR